eukprot:gene18123-19933_t
MELKKVFFLLLIGAVVFATPKPKDRTIKDEELSTEEHSKDGEHNKEYDHEAFLGKDEAEKFDDLTPEQSKERLQKLVNEKIDKDGDGFVTEQELKDWIKYAQNKYIYEDAEKQLVNNDMNKDGYVTWEEYKNNTYGFLEDDSGSDYDYKSMVNRDERRFKKADKDADGKLDKNEFTAFLHPENDEQMKDVVVDETMEDIDKDKDGFISQEEYIGDLWPESDREAGKEEPDYIKTEKEQFGSFRDLNKDGKMDREEVKNWILPPDYDHVSAEVKHLIQESDTDKDNKLSTKEIVDKYDLFVGSQATDFGEALKKHDEF